MYAPSSIGLQIPVEKVLYNFVMSTYLSQ